MLNSRSEITEKGGSMNDQELFEVVLFRYEAVSGVTALVDYGETLQSALAHIAQTIGPAPGSQRPPRTIRRQVVVHRQRNVW